MLWSEFMYFQNMRCEEGMYLETIFIIVLEPDLMVNPGQSPGYLLNPRSRVGLTIVNPS